MNDAFHTRYTLLQRVTLQHDDKSWEEFTHYYQKFIYLICRRMNLSHHDAEEVVQKVLIKLWKQLPEKKPEDFPRFRSWLCTVTGNTTKDFLRMRIRRSDKESKAGEDANFKYTQPDIEEIAEEEWKKFIVAQATVNIKKNFSEQVLEVFKAIHEGKSIQQVAEQFQIPPNTVSVYKRRVIQAMCAEIRRLENDLA